MTDLQAAREKTVRDHMELENQLDWDAVIATFQHPRYELYGVGTVFDGEEAVRKYFAQSRATFPDQRNEIISLGSGGDCVFVEFWLMGTHLGESRGPDGPVAPSGKTFKVRMSAVFEFAAGTDKIVCERPYFDPRAIQLQLA